VSNVVTSDFLNILVVDDSLTLRNYMEYTLPKIDNQQIKITLTSSGEEALKQVSSENFDLVFLDVIMPGMDGYKTCKAIKGKTDARVIMLTSKKSRMDKARSALSGSDGFITKPPSLTQLREEIIKCRQARDAARRSLDKEANEVTEKRRRVRVALPDPLRVLDVRTQRLLGTVININVDGILLLSKVLITVNVEFDLSLELREIIDGSKSIHFRAKSVWFDSALKTPDQCWTGFSITNIAQSDSSRIETLTSALL